MILHYGTEAELAALADTDWYMVELRSEKTIESTLKRIGTQIPAIFVDSAIEIFIPVMRRDINLFELKTSTYLFARSRNFHGLLRLRTITGVVGLVTLGDTNHPSKAIPVSREYVASMIAESRALFESRSRSITLGSFVRIIDGDEKNFCGVVVDITATHACIEIDIKTKIILVETPVSNLLDLSHVPEDQRVFYYSPAVEALVKTDQLDLMAEDRRFVEDTVYHEDHYGVEQTDKRGRQQTVTALVKRLILTGTLAPNLLATAVVAALKDGRLKVPKSLTIVHGIIKHRLIVDYFSKLDPGIANYREVVSRYGQAWRFPLNEFVMLGKDLDLPVTTHNPVVSGSSGLSQMHTTDSIGEAEHDGTQIPPETDRIGVDGSHAADSLEPASLGANREEATTENHDLGDAGERDQRCSSGMPV